MVAGESCRADQARAGLLLFEEFLRQCLRGRWEHHGVCVKVPVFDTADLLYAEEVLQVLRKQSDSIPMYLSVGNSWVFPPNTVVDSLRTRLLDRLDKIFRLVVAGHPKLQECAILPQLHVLQFGNELRR